MKVVLFCGGFGMRMRQNADSLPKPMIQLGHRPIIWHIMKYYAYFGHKEFILCLGWKGEVIKEFFLNYEQKPLLARNNVDMPGGDVPDWRIRFIDTGISSTIGQRLKKMETHLQGTQTFLANYTDGLTDFRLPDLIDFHFDRKVIATFLSVKPNYNSFNAVKADSAGFVHHFPALENLDLWINGGFFVFSTQIFQYIREGEEFVEQPFKRLIALKRLGTLKYSGFWACMDTFKEMEMLNDMLAQGKASWEVWK